MYVDGKPNEDKHLLNLAKCQELYHQAFFSMGRSEQWCAGGSCDSNVPLSGGSEVVQEGSSDPTVEGALSRTKIQILVNLCCNLRLRDRARFNRLRGLKQKI